jgi:MoaA/NifB/PqqE/SkfB family radical SAM enzyme
MPYKLRRLVIKPTLACTAHCPSCALRLKLYRECRDEKSLDLDQWRVIIQDAHRLGCTDLHISGGEPTLYPELIELVEMGTRWGMVTNVNTNGSCIPPGMARELARAGLGSITVSLYSWQAQVHDQARQEPGLFERAIGAIERLQAQPGLLVDLQTLLSNYNVLDFDRFLEMAYRLGVGYVYVSYIEGDVEKRWLPTLGQIRQFRAEVLPRAKALIHRLAPPELREEALKQVESIFPDDVQRAYRFASGVYHPDQKPNCPRPYSFALVLTNGQVHPCNGVEYCHEPVMGNAHKSRLVDLWASPAWERFRVERMEWCHRCPMNLHFRIPIRGEKQCKSL